MAGHTAVEDGVVEVAVAVGVIVGIAIVVLNRFQQNHLLLHL